MRRTCLLDGEMRVILLAKGMAKLKKAIEADRDKAIVIEKMEVIVNPRNRENQVHAARNDNIPVQARWLTRPNDEIRCATRSAYATNSE